MLPVPCLDRSYRHGYEPKIPRRTSRTERCQSPGNFYIEQLAELTPWTEDAIRTMVARGKFKLGVHYFKPHGPNSRPIFSWEAVVKYIEVDDNASRAGDVMPLADGTLIDLNETTAKAHGLRD